MIEAIPAALADERLDRVISLLTGLSRSAAATAITDELVSVDGAGVVKVSFRVREGQTVEIDDIALEDRPGLAADPDVDVSVQYVDDDVIIVDKAPGQVVHPGAGNQDGTIANGILARYPEVADIGEPDRPGVVHRLDKGTSGVFVIARSGEAYDSLTAQLKRRSVERTYLTLAWGEPGTDRGLVDAPIGRAIRDPTRMVVRDDGKPARTRYEVIARWHDPTVALMSCALETGRTHQIRVHLEAIHHPVAGDPKYGGGRDTLGMERPALHAAELGFAHPTTGEWVSFSSPLPPDMVSVLDDLGNPSIGSVPA